jgi:hypothetical protein
MIENPSDINKTEKLCGFIINLCEDRIYDGLDELCFTLVDGIYTHDFK